MPVAKGYAVSEEINCPNDKIGVVRTLEKFTLVADVTYPDKKFPSVSKVRQYTILAEKDEDGRLTVSPQFGKVVFEFKGSSPMTIKAIATLMLKVAEL